jgi:hypothetical protein
MKNYQIINSDSVIASYIYKCTSEDGNIFYSVKFPRIVWALFENKYYDRDVSASTHTDNVYRHETHVPKYNIFRNHVKIGNAYPRLTEDDAKFLFIPRTYVKRNTGRMGRPKRPINRNYYIYEVNDDYEIQEKDAKLLFYQ